MSRHSDTVWRVMYHGSISECWMQYGEDFGDYNEAVETYAHHVSTYPNEACKLVETSQAIAFKFTPKTGEES